MNRRRFLVTTGSSISLLVAGCTSIDVNSTSGSSLSPESSTPETTLTASPTATQTPIPTLDNAEWTHPGYDAEGTRYVSGTLGPATKPRTAWRVESSGVLGFAIAEGRLFVLRDTGCVALDATSGETVWEVSLPSPNMPATANVTAMPGPVYADKTVFVAAGNNLRALSSGDGSEKWTISPPGGPITDLAVTGERVYVTTGEADSGDPGYLSAVETGDGSERWRVAADQIRQPAGTIASEVAVGGDAVAAISARIDGSYTVNFAVEKTDGAKRWASTGRNHGRALTVADDRVYIGGFQGYVGPENTTTGERL